MVYRPETIAKLKGKVLTVLKKEAYGLYVCECEVEGKKIKLKVHVVLPSSTPKKIRIAWLTRCDQLSDDSYELFGSFDADLED
ncbi:MAG: hypothetical protein H9W81_16615 [Enterococcus sp.]|nr:hypothetical protein [Enterococcus sp.]